MATLTVTVIYDAMPTPIERILPYVEPDIASSLHPAIVRIAVGLLLIKEGSPEAERGLALVQSTLKGIKRDDIRRST